MIEVTISKTKLDEARSRERVKCLFYDVKPNSKQSVEPEMNLKKTTQKIYPQNGKIYGRDDSSLSYWIILQLAVDRGKFCGYCPYFFSLYLS